MGLEPDGTASYRRVGTINHVRLRGVSYPTTRLWVWLPPAFFFGFSVIVALAAPDIGQRIFYVLLALVTGYWLVRSLRVRVEISAEAIAAFGQLRTRRYPIAVVRGARAEPMRTASPLYRFAPYVALTLDFESGESRHFDEISVRQRDQEALDRIVTSINEVTSSGGA